MFKYIYIYERRPTTLPAPAQNFTFRDNSARLLCSSHTCAPGTVLIPDAADTECNFGLCATPQCCPRSCSKYVCRDASLVLIEDADTTACENSFCNDEDCCESADR